MLNGNDLPNLDSDFISLELALRHHQSSEDPTPAELYRVFIPVEKGMRLIPDVTALDNAENNRAAHAFAARLMTGMMATMEMLCAEGYLTKCETGMAVVMVGKGPQEADQEKWHGKGEA